MFGKLIPWRRKNDKIKVHHENHPVARLRQDFDELFERFFDDWRLGDLSLRDDSYWLGSRVEFDDRDKEYVIHAELPGFEPEDFDLSVSGNVLTVKAEHNEEEKEKEGSYRRYGSVYESFTLPQGVLTDQIDARYHSGVLEIHLPKSEECKPRRIEVKA